jgi:hypothetical protein
MTNSIIDPRPLSPADMPEYYLPWKADYGRNRIVNGTSFDDLIESVRYDLEQGFEVEYFVDARRYDHDFNPQEDVGSSYSVRMAIADDHGSMFFRIQELETGTTIEEGISISDAVYLTEVCCYCKDHFSIMFGPHDPTP